MKKGHIAGTIYVKFSSTIQRRLHKTLTLIDQTLTKGFGDDRKKCLCIGTWDDKKLRVFFYLITFDSTIRMLSNFQQLLSCHMWLLEKQESTSCNV